MARNPEYDPDVYSKEIEEMLMAQHAEIESLVDLEKQRGTPIPALFNQFYKFVQNPSTVSVATYKRMLDTDDTIGSGVDFLASCLAARMGRYEHPSEEISEFVNEALEQIDGGWHSALKDGFNAIWAGFSIQEKVWGNTPKGFLPKKIAALPPTTMLFETDRVGEITEDGILQYQRNYNPYLLGQGLGYFGFNTGMTYGATDRIRPDGYAKLGDFPYPIRVANSWSYLSIRIPKLKCIHYSFGSQGNFGNPYGRSMLRRAYKWWVMKDAFLKMMSIALDRKGTPLTVVFADPNSTMLQSKAYNPNLPPGQQQRIRGDIAAREAFKNIHNDSTIILPGKKGQMYDLEFVPQDSNTESFIAAINLCDKGILRSLLIPSLIFGNGDGTGSFALGQEHAKTFEKILDSILQPAKEVYRNQLVKEMIAYNFPKSAWEKDGLGNFTNRELSRDEVEKEMEVFNGGIDRGIIDVNDLNDLNKMREIIGFDPKTIDERRDDVLNRQQSEEPNDELE